MRYGIWRPGTPNYQETRFGEKLTAVVIHRMVGYLFGTDAWFKNPDSGASTHFGIGWASIADEQADDVSVYQWVDTADTAWGWSAVPTDKQEAFADMVLHPSPDLNRQVIHIELGQFHEPSVNLATQPFRPSIYKALNKLLAAIAEAHPGLVLLEHNDVSTKPCPGPINWTRIWNGYGSILVAEEDPAVIAELKAQLAECRADRLNLRGRVQKLLGTRESLQAKVASLEDILAEIEAGRIPELEGQVARLRQRIREIKDTVSSMADEVLEA